MYADLVNKSTTWYYTEIVKTIYFIHTEDQHEVLV